MFLKFTSKHKTLVHITPDLSLLTYIQADDNTYFKIAAFIKVDMIKFYLNKKKISIIKLSKCCYAILKSQ